MTSEDIQAAAEAMQKFTGQQMTHIIVGAQSAEVMGFPSAGAYEKQDGVWVRVGDDAFDVIQRKNQ